MSAWLRICILLLTALVTVPSDATGRSPGGSSDDGQRGVVVRDLRYGDSRIILSFTPSEFRLTEEDIVDWVLRSARATATFFGRFPVPEVRISLKSGSGNDVSEGMATATPKPRIRVVIGRRTTRETLRRESTMVHEMTHLAFPDVDEAYLWLHEGIATYVETVAFAQASEITPAQAWGHIAREMPQGMPESGDQGLNDTPNWDRRYWGGAMFCLTADLEIRRRTDNRYGLKDALRAVLNAGGTLAHTWEVERALAIADRAVGVPVLSELYAIWGTKSVAPNLEKLWSELGVEQNGRGTRLVDTSPRALARRAITAQPQQPLLLIGPSLVREAVTGQSPDSSGGRPQ